MNSRERVARALRGEPVDRPPIGFFAIDSDTVERILGRRTYLRAKAKSQIAFWEGRRDEVVQSWREDFLELYRKLDFVDVLPVSVVCSGLAPPKGYRPEAPRCVDENTWEFKDGRVLKYSPLTQDLTQVHDPHEWSREFRTEDFDPEKAAAPVPPPDPSVFEAVDPLLEAFARDRYVLGPCGGEVGLMLLGGMERGLVELAENPELVRRATECAVLSAEARDEHYIRPGAAGVMWGQDFGFNQGPMVSPEVFRGICLPAIRRRTQRLHARGLTVVKHACGNNWKLLEMFVEAGYDAYQSVQVSAGMDLARVKAAVGSRLTLMAGVQVETLVSGTPADVRREVDEAFRVLAPGGRFIFSTSHSVTVGTKYENFMAMLDRFHELCAKGGYT
jgi:uroporphyrinogen-III decarboxylase